jgi:hypothetical protein
MRSFLVCVWLSGVLSLVLAGCSTPRPRASTPAEMITTKDTPQYTSPFAIDKLPKLNFREIV